MSSVKLTDLASFDTQWSARLGEDRARAASLQAPSQLATETILKRALAVGAEAVVLTGSTVRSRRTPASDLDFMIVGELPALHDVHEDIDVYAASAKAFWERLLAGDDYIQWTLRFGWILHDQGILRDSALHIQNSGLKPSADRKLAQAQRGMALAWLVLESGDVDAAREQCCSALTTVGRWLLIANGALPLCRDELADQLLALGLDGLAAVLHDLIHGAPSSDELRSGLELGEQLVSPTLTGVAPSGG